MLVVLVGLVLGCGDDLTPVEARVALTDLGIAYNADAFLAAVTGAVKEELAAVKRQSKDE